MHMAPSMKIYNRDIFEAQFLPGMCGRNVDEVKHGEWESLLCRLSLERKWSPATFNRRRALVMSFYNWCIHQSLARENPIQKIRKRREPENEPRFLTAPQMQSFLEVCEKNEYAACFYLLANTGMRISEALGLRWSDVDLNGGWIRIGRIFCRATNRIEERTKGGHTRIIGLNRALRDVLLRERQRAGERIRKTSSSRWGRKRKVPQGGS